MYCTLKLRITNTYFGSSKCLSLNYRYQLNQRAVNVGGSKFKKFKNLLSIIQRQSTCIDTTCAIVVTYNNESIVKMEISVLSSVAD